ncbi:hypothetical protein F4V43_09580 [Paenibacillus spiritus]|uniref:Thioredoxin domain-containing protein n=1 Tax=Paenibacillus spiritus TaxID=2496557 RepID=A0A5J5GAF5_9BACL|nr:hypothetical protein [Paenibacillus spiritus]KAA9004873.1 hypothetical protein F4V43_09580 [Paenibacillus spiritus]
MLTKDTGIPLGEKLLNEEFVDCNGVKVSLTSSGRPMVLVFLSLYCKHCIDFTPYLLDIHRAGDFDLYLFSNGSDEDHREMKTYFQWSFPIITLSPEAMDKHFRVSVLPFIMVIDPNMIVLQKGVVYNPDDFYFLYGKEKKYKK